MKICVVGFGTVGKAQAHLLKELGHQVFAYDPYVLPKSELEKQVELTFVCTPENTVEEVLRELMAKKAQGLFVIKSTTPIGTTERLMQNYKIHICHNPEFLREAHRYEDVLKPERVIIGQCCQAHGRLLAELYSPLNKPIFLTTPTASELAKLTSNAYLSTLITFWNEIAELTEKLSLNAKEVAELVCADQRMSKYGTARFREPFSGKCLPKDLDSLILTFHQFNLNPIVFNGIKKYNRRFQDLC